jgi:hypothetical protein
VTVFDHQRNVSACENGWKSCDHLKLSPSEAVRVKAAERANR